MFKKHSIIPYIVIIIIIAVALAFHAKSQKMFDDEVNAIEAYNVAGITHEVQGDRDSRWISFTILEDGVQIGAGSITKSKEEDCSDWIEGTNFRIPKPTLAGESASTTLFCTENFNQVSITIYEGEQTQYIEQMKTL